MAFPDEVKLASDQVFMERSSGWDWGGIGGLTLGWGRGDVLSVHATTAQFQPRRRRSPRVTPNPSALFDCQVHLSVHCV